jgi:hypothetical protein
LFKKFRQAADLSTEMGNKGNTSVSGDIMLASRGAGGARYFHPETPEPRDAQERAVERRRTIRIKRSGLLRHRLDDIDRPAIKFAENIDELQQAFSLLHDVYLRMGYLSQPKGHGMLFTIHSLLPETAVFVAKSYLTVISTLTEIFDTEAFGLPMDAIYRKEVDALRENGRKVVELSALVSPKNLRWRNLFMYLAQVMYWYSSYRGVNDLCIAVNPKHVRFYKNIFLFEDLGPERHFPKVGAPAVALRINMDNIKEKVKEVYGDLDFDCNLYDYFHRMTGEEPINYGFRVNGSADSESAKSALRNVEMVKFFLGQEENLLNDLTVQQKAFLNKVYPGLNIT